MDITIFSDVVCTWSYGEEKVLRAIDYIYYGKVKFNNIMGGLIADFKDILPINMKDKASTEMANKILLSLWKSGEGIHNMPVMKEAPNLLSEENYSTNFLDEAFIAARLTDPNNANLFLRNLREATILDGENTFDKNVLKDIAKKSEIDVDEYLSNLENFAKEEFLKDRIATFDRRMTTFPNFMYINSKGKEIVIRGYKSLEELMSFIDNIEMLKKRKIEISKESIFDFIKKYRRVFLADLIELFKDKKKIEEFINELVLEEKILKREVSNTFEFKII